MLTILQIWQQFDDNCPM